MDQINPKEIQTHEIFKSLFPVDPKLLSKIQENMKTSHYHYDPSQPIILATWPGQTKPVLIDGHTRVRASINVGIEKVPVLEHEFDSEQEALEHTIRLQSNRRNLTDADILSCVEVLHKARPRGGDRRSGQAKSKPQSCGNENCGPASATTAELLNISSRKVEQTLRVIKNATLDLKEAVLRNEMSINRACEEIKKESAEEIPDEECNEIQSPSPASDNMKPATGSAQAHDKSKKTEKPEKTKPAGQKNVKLRPDQYQALAQLGGDIEEHVASAIDLYLESQRGEYGGLPGEKQHDNRAEATVHLGEDDHDDTDDDETEDEEEWFDPADYDEELAAEGFAGSFNS